MKDILMVTEPAIIVNLAAGEILKINETTAEHGLLLTEEQATALAVSREEILRTVGRIEFGGGIICRLAEAFCDSPYINSDHWEETLLRLMELFYAFKNETWDVVSDEELIRFMKETFDGTCGGSLELLAEREMPAFAERMRWGGKR